MNIGLEESLRIARIGDLPPAIDDKYDRHWIKAIVRVRRSNGDTGYCIAINDGRGNPKFVRDINPTGIIIGVISVHPYEETRRGIMPRFTSDEQVKKYLCKYGYNRAELDALLAKDGKTAEQTEADKDVVRGYIAQVASMQAQIKSESDEQARVLVAMADPKLKEKNIKAKKYGRKNTPRKTKGSKSED